jgi:AraC family transcriptional regulator of adaptative response/methylated-DNA-[protein]-cysteine methyltransferase
MNDYEKIARAITYLVEHAPEQPDLPVLANQAGLSPAHFQRKFTAWTGVSPKAFLQNLTLQHAREMLTQGRPVEVAAWSSGLSGPGRLHDLCVKLEAATPGEIRRGGLGLAIRYGFGATPFGECLLADTPRGICYLAFVAGSDRQTVLGELRQLWPNATVTQNPDSTLGLIQQIFNLQSVPPGTPLRAYVKGTQFQLQIWRALLKIPEGQLVSYGDIASRIRKPESSRAVGTAVGANQLAYLIPCHRVIRNTGVIGQYRWGSTRKKLMLACEYARKKTPHEGGVYT